MRYGTKARLAALALLTGLGMALLAGAAGATHVGWHETAMDGRTPVLGFTVTTLDLGSANWSAHVTITNLSKQTIHLGDTYGLEIYGSATATQLTQGLAFGRATTFSPKRPTLLKPGASWSGTIGGKGHPPTSTATRYARLVFGPFSDVPGQKAAILWVTNHALRVAGSPPSA